MDAISLPPENIMHRDQIMSSCRRLHHIFLTAIGSHIIFQCKSQVGLCRVRPHRLRHQVFCIAGQAPDDRIRRFAVRTFSTDGNTSITSLQLRERIGSPPRIERTQLIALSIYVYEINQAAANVANCHIRISSRYRLSNHSLDIHILQSSVAIDGIHFLALWNQCIPVFST